MTNRERKTERQTKYVFPAVFTKEEAGYSVVFPDLEAATSGETLIDAMEMARDALCLTLYDMEETGAAIPAPADIAAISYPEGSFVTLVECDTLEYRRFYDSRAVKKTLSIPAWLNAMAEREDINFSAVLQKALRTELHL